MTPQMTPEQPEQSAAPSGRRRRPRLVHVSTSRVLGGVTEVVRGELPYFERSGWATEWVAAEARGDRARDAGLLLHNALYQAPGGGFSAARARSGIAEYVAANAPLRDLVRGADVVVLHDPLCLTLAPELRPLAGRIVWRCHIGSERSGLIDRAALDLMRPYLDHVDRIVFSLDELVWPGLAGDERLLTVPPGIDPESPKNRDIEPAVRAAIWRRLSAGETAEPPVGRDGADAGAGQIAIDDGGTGRLAGPRAPFVLQVSRWDPLKGQLGVLRGFAELARREPEIELLIVGPYIDEARNYPINRRVWTDLLEARARLDAPIRRRTHIWRFARIDRMAEDVALNVLRHQARTVVQNSRRESFGLTVAEAMWRGAVVVGSAVEGIRRQIEHDVNGLLTPYTEGDATWAGAVRRSLWDDGDRARWSAAARRTIGERFLVGRAVDLQSAAFLAA
ncbi:MAG TPA: glycosyltransferase [Streptosporangiaceae bacterium]|nr:glycosyltransferase [Streptosporangiaceae bacterium]